MLVDLPATPVITDPTLSVVLSVLAGGRLNAERIGRGMYATHHFNFNLSLGDWCVSESPFDPFSKIDRTLTGDERFAAIQAAIDAQNPDAPHDYGVCDTPQQLVDKYPIIDTDPRPFVVSFTRIAKADEPQTGGWRWHKWGPYIGDKHPQHEYLAHEGPDITEVWFYSIYEVAAP